MDKNYKCLIIDDEPLAIRLIKAHVAQVPGLEVAGSCQNAMDAMAFLKKEQVDLLFLDIQMPVLSGIELIKSLQQPPAVILTTAYREYAVESYELDVVDYLLKPITFPRFLKAVDKFMNQQQAISTPINVSASEEQESSFYVNANKKYIKIEFEEVLYIESMKDYIRIHLPERTITTKEKIGEFEAKLPAHFLRIHRSFIVNLKKISAFTAQDVEIGKKEIPIGSSYRKEVQQRLHRP